MSTNRPIANYDDGFLKDILDFGSVDTGTFLFSRQYDFIATGASLSVTSSNVLTHFYDQDIYPPSLSSVTGSAMFCTATNSSSGMYYVALKRLYDYRALESFQGVFSITALTSSLTSIDFQNTGKFDMNYWQGNPAIYESFSASVTGIYVYNFNKNVYGDRILDNSLSLFTNGVMVAHDDTTIAKNSPIYTLTSSMYYDSSTSVTRFWVLPDIGNVISWSSDGAINDSLSSVNEISFRNSVVITNTTVNLRIEPEEFNVSENFSFYLRDFSAGELPDTWITTIGLYNDWGDLIAIAKPTKPIRKASNIPLTFKISLDYL